MYKFNHVWRIDGNFNGVKKSIEHGVDVNCKNKYVDTPLHYSSRNGNLDILTTYLVL